MTSSASPSRPRRREPLRARPEPDVDLATPTVDLREEDTHPRILIVEDEMDIREWLRVSLQQRGWRVNCAPSVSSALEMAGRLRPQLVLLDQRLPDGKGLDCAQVLRDRHPEMRLIMFSAYLDVDAEAMADELGVQTISKVDVKALLDVLAAHQQALSDALMA